MSERAPGFYWVLWKDGSTAWEPAEWTGHHWIALGVISDCRDDDASEVGPRIGGLRQDRFHR